MNKLFIGLKKEIELPAHNRRKKSGFLFIDDDVPDISDALIFDPRKHCFNPLEDIDYKKARELAEGIYTIYPQGQDTLTVRGGRRGLARLFLRHERFDKIQAHLRAKQKAHEEDKKNNEPLSPTEIEVLGVISDILLSPILKRMLCNPTNFSFNPRSTILAKVSRAELGEFDALVIGLLLMARFKGQLVVPDLGFYGRDIHTALIREERLIGGVNALGELPERLRRQALLIPDKVARGALYDDAVDLAKLNGLVPQTNEFHDFIRGAMSASL